MATLILSALEEEIAACRERLSGRRDDRWREFTLSVGGLGGDRVAVAGTGVGKTMSALATQHWIDELRPERVFFVGTAGGLGADVAVGDVIVAADALQYDLDVRAAGLELGRVPFTDYRFIECDRRLVEAAMSYQPAGFRLLKGRVLTGDRLITRTSGKTFTDSVAGLDGMAVDMEGASAGLVCRVNAVPFLLLRFVSDRPGSAVRSDFRRLLPIASKRLLAIVEHILMATDEG